MQLAQRAGLERHVNAGKFVGDGEALNVCLFGSTAIEFLGGDSAKRIAERGKLFAGERRRRRPELRL